MKRKIVGLILLLILWMSACGQLAESDSETAVSAPPQRTAELVVEEGNGRMMAPSGNISMSESMSNGNNQMADSFIEETGGMLSVFSRDDAPEIKLNDITVVNDESRRAKQVVLIFANHDNMSQFLSAYPNWVAEVWEDDENLFGIDIYDGNTEEWLGWGQVDFADGTVVDSYVPMDLSPELFQARRDLVEAFIFADAELLARLEAIEQWEYETYYNKWDEAFETYFYKGLDELVVISFVDSENNEIYIETIEDPAALSEEDTLREVQDRAVVIAYEAENLWDYLRDVDDWSTYVTPIDDSQWMVEFATTDARLFYALVDVSSEKIIETGQ